MNDAQFNKIYNFLQGDKFAYIVVKKNKNTTMTANKQKVIEQIELMGTDFLRINVNTHSDNKVTFQNVTDRNKSKSYFIRNNTLQAISNKIGVCVDKLLFDKDVLVKPIADIKKQQQRKRVNAANKRYNQKVKSIEFANKRTPKSLVEWVSNNKQVLDKKATKYERLLFNALKKHFKDKIKKQQPFMIQNKVYYADICISPLKLIIEVDGGYHNSQEQQIKDRQRDNDFKSIGYNTLRFTNEQVQNKTSRQQIVNKILDYKNKFNQTIQ